jgi:hypothetical protein
MRLASIRRDRLRVWGIVPVDVTVSSRNLASGAATASALLISIELGLLVPRCAAFPAARSGSIVGSFDRRSRSAALRARPTERLSGTRRRFLPG